MVRVVTNDVHAPMLCLIYEVAKPCSKSEWTCENGQCIEDGKRCNVQVDCLDHSDEKDCGQFKYTHRKKIVPFKFCKGIVKA